MPQTLSKAIKRPLSDSLKNSLKGRTAFSHVFLKPQKYVTHFHCKRFPDTWFWFVHSIFHSVAQMKTEKMFWAKWRQLKKKWHDLERGEVSLMSVSHNPLTLLKRFCGSVDNSKCLGICPASFGAWESCTKSSCNLGTGALNFFLKFETRSHYAAPAGLKLRVPLAFAYRALGWKGICHQTQWHWRSFRKMSGLSQL